ncbi:ABC transporter ATP-binding protein [Gemmiger formicilis]|uniref:ABC transporter ATP-binding protein n=1 Tax=Gemmiger formicilis TaxID=745368 RepID=UPI0019595DE4|nr:ABC transporter ATP-binding protein [Gemmiger formicilis]MBM6914375.1 ABC transporter ATP-binding protein [Gemmiger formicilis]
MAGNQTEMIPSKVSLRGVKKIYQGASGDVVALNGVDLEIRNNEFICVVGPSGCGKSTLLNILAGLDRQTEGEVLVDGKAVNGPSGERGVVFQQYALFPWLTVRQNIAFGLHNKKLPAKEIDALVERYVHMVALEDFLDSYPKELSGGMKQRVALARAYAMNPSLLLMDEPFGALDAQTRAQLQADLLEIWEKENKTCFFITHDVEEAVLLAQRVVIMSARPGRINRIVDVDIPYPRTQQTRLSPRFTELKNDIWATVYNEYLEDRR